jgi:hypothetical protein
MLHKNYPGIVTIAEGTGNRLPVSHCPWHYAMAHHWVSLFVIIRQTCREWLGSAVRWRTEAWASTTGSAWAFPTCGPRCAPKSRHVVDTPRPASPDLRRLVMAYISNVLVRAGRGLEHARHRVGPDQPQVECTSRWRRHRATDLEPNLRGALTLQQQQ